MFIHLDFVEKLNTINLIVKLIKHNYINYEETVVELHLFYETDMTFYYSRAHDALCVSGDLQSCAKVGHTFSFCAGSSKVTEEDSSNDPVMEDHGY